VNSSQISFNAENRALNSTFNYSLGFGQVWNDSSIEGEVCVLASASFGMLDIYLVFVLLLSFPFLF